MNAKHEAMSGDLRHDPLEDDPQIGPIIRKAEKDAEEELSGEPEGLGFCHLLWATQKEIPQTKYRISWETPAEMNPDVIFD